MRVIKKSRNYANPYLIKLAVTRPQRTNLIINDYIKAPGVVVAKLINEQSVSSNNDPSDYGWYYGRVKALDSEMQNGFLIATGYRIKFAGMRHLVRFTRDEAIMNLFKVTRQEYERFEEEMKHQDQDLPELEDDTAN